MIPPARRWIVLGVLYGAFFAWYTSWRGPLSGDEIAHYVGIVEARGAAAADVARLRRFLEQDSGDDFVIVNIIALREPPAPVAGVAPGETATEVLDRYMAYMWPALLRRACHPVLVGTAAAPALDVWGVADAETWSQAGLMRYRSRRDLMEIATNPEFRGRHEFKVAAMLKTIAFPIDPWFQLGDPRLVLGLVLLVIGLALGSRGRTRG